MQDVTIDLDNRPGALAEMGEALARSGISIEGGGVFSVDGRSAAHFLFHDGSAARRALETASIRVAAVRDVVLLRLRQDEPGQLGKLSRRMADAGVNIEVQYSDHDHQLVLVVDNAQAAQEVSEQWSREREAPSALMASPKQHAYALTVSWTGNLGVGTKNYKSFARNYIVQSNGKPPLEGSSDPAFRGDAARYNPEEMLVASLSSCHMLWYLHLCSVNGVVVLDYQDAASGVMIEDANGSGKFTSVALNPAVTIAAGSDPIKALQLHEEAHRMCFIARSVNFPVETHARILEETPSR